MPTISDDDLVSVLQHMADLSARRSELSAERSFQNAERNLSLLIHSAAALMILGLSVDRYLLFVRGAAGQIMPGVGVSMVAIGALASLLGGLRYLFYVRSYHRDPRLYPRHSAYLAPAFALLAGSGGAAMLVYILLVGH